MRQIHKKFSNEQVKEVLDKHEKGIFKRQIIEQLLGIGRSQFFNLLKEYRNDKAKFSIDYKRSTNTNEIDDDKNDLILYELKEQLKLIQDSKIPIYRYNYSYAQQAILRKYNVKVSRQTIASQSSNSLIHYLIILVFLGTIFKSIILTLH